MRRIQIKRKRTGLGLTILLVLLICGIVSYSRIGLEAASKRTIEQREECKEKRDKLLEEVEENEKATVLTESEIEKIAREKFGLVYDDEIIFKAEE